MERKIITLDKLKKGQKGKVLYLNNDVHLKRRLMDIGIIEGVDIECSFKSPLGDPTAYIICGAVIALRCEDASKIVMLIL